MATADPRAAVLAHPDFPALVSLEAERRRMVRRPGGRSALAANSAACMRAEQRIMRDTGASFSTVSGAALAQAGRQ